MCNLMYSFLSLLALGYRRSASIQEHVGEILQRSDCHRVSEYYVLVISSSVFICMFEILILIIPYCALSFALSQSHDYHMTVTTSD